MTVVIRNNSGTALTDAIISDIGTTNATKSAKIPLPGVDADVIQKFGKNNKEFTIKGIVTGSTGVSFLQNALNYTGSLYFYSEAMAQVLIATTVVYYANLEWEDSGARPLERKFTLDLVEVL